jgi:hypothetical protein
MTRSHLALFWSDICCLRRIYDWPRKDLRMPKAFYYRHPTVSMAQGTSARTRWGISVVVTTKRAYALADGLLPSEPDASNHGGFQNTEIPPSQDQLLYTR